MVGGILRRRDQSTIVTPREVVHTQPHWHCSQMLEWPWTPSGWGQGHLPGSGQVCGPSHVCKS